MKLDDLKCILVKLLSPCYLVAVRILSCLSLLLRGKGKVVAVACLIVVLIVLSLIANLIVGTHIVVFILCDRNGLVGADSADLNNSLKCAVVVERECNYAQNDNCTKNNGNNLVNYLFSGISCLHAVRVFLGRFCNTSFSFIAVLLCL